MKDHQVHLWQSNCSKETIYHLQTCCLCPLSSLPCSEESLSGVSVGHERIKCFEKVIGFARAVLILSAASQSYQPFLLEDRWWKRSAATKDTGFWILPLDSWKLIWIMVLTRSQTKPCLFHFPFSLIRLYGLFCTIRQQHGYLASKHIHFPGRQPILHL